MENILNEILKEVKTIKAEAKIIKADVAELKQRQDRLDEKVDKLDEKVTRLEQGQQENTESIECILEITSTIERVTQNWNDENNRKIEALSRKIN